ncbi:DinB family protein [Streptomyces sp. UNOC14_S4]|uniref:DinB family protein n=1 Tax=Streptomyces sp. UNOC14_S4 TaxID=2872340 RepID=UPI001E6201B5|nr:DinB family protein [Streptomyces sp. UNOC14_S4]MCC3771756.1 DinB family protein [Streptomyces sp. UNOC14_S4]
MNASERPEPPTVADERTSLESWLDFHRATLALKCAGLDDRQLREVSVPPSSLTLLGLVRHMAEVERNWFRRVLGGEDARPLYYGDDDPDGEFHVTERDTWDEAHAAWQAEIAAAREAARGRSLDDRGVSPRSGKEFDLRWIYIHMIEEYARHNGHADLIRERIDGVTGE